jgi:hypothetical protein
MNNKCSKILEEVNPLDPDAIKDALNKRLVELEFDEVGVTEVEVDFDGQIHVTFFDVEDNEELMVMFGLDEDNTPDVVVIDYDEDDDDAEYTVIDLSTLDYKVVDTDYGQYLDYL